MLDPIQKPSSGGGLISRFLSESATLRHYLWKYRRTVGVGLAALLMVDLLEVVPPLFMAAAIDLALGKTVSLLGIWRPTFAGLAWAYLGVAFLQAVGRYGWRMYLIRAGVIAGRDMRGRFARHLFGLSASFFDRTPIGELMSLATNDVEAVRNMIGSGFLTLADSLIYAVSVPAAMWMLSPKLTLIAFIPLPFLPWIIRRNEREVHARFERVQECFSELSAMTQESLNGVRVLKGFAREGTQAERFRQVGERFVRLNLRLARVQSSFGPTMDFAMSLGMVFLLIVGGKMVLAGAVTLGTFVAFQRYIQKMVWPMAALGLALGAYERSVSSAGRIGAVQSETTDIPDLGEAAELPASAALGGPPGGVWKTEGRIEFRDLSFSFPGTGAPALRGISLGIEPGERVAFVGTIGSGKSALLSLLPRIYPVDHGMLFIDGIDVNRWPLAELRRQVGYVGQEVFLFSESVLENIAYGLHERIHAGPGDRRENLVHQASRLACVHEDVSHFVSSYATRVGERGVSVSGGQKQRLTIARALVQEPSVLVLDDALSAVDVRTEEKILTGLRARPGRNTELIAAHRISTVRSSDRIVVLENGGVAQMGSHQSLLAEADGIYARFYAQQRLEEELRDKLEEYESRLGIPGALSEEAST